MTPESQQPDREPMIADDRIDRQVEAMLAAAAMRRAGRERRPQADDAAATIDGAELAQAHVERDDLRARLAASESERERAETEARALSARAADLDRQLRELEAQPQVGAEGEPAADLLVAAARAADDVRDASRARALRTLTKARDLAALVHADTEREREALAESQRRRAEVEGEAQEILMEAHATAESFVAGVVAARRAEAEREAEELLSKARADAQREAEELLSKARAAAEREAEELLSQARADAGRIVAAVSDERHRLREILASTLGTLDELDADDAAPADDLIADLGSRLHETADG